MKKLKDAFRLLIFFPYEEEHRDQLKLEMVNMNFNSERIVAYVMMLMQVFMILVFTMRPGGITYSYRRLRYVITYSSLLMGFIVLLPLHKRSINNWRMHSVICIAFATLICLWTMSISYLDSLGGVSIIVYCSTLPIMATFILIPPHILSILFIFTCIATDFLVLSTPYGQENLFSVLTNSAFICILSIIYAYRMYHTRLTSVYNRMVIKQKNEQLEEANKELNLLSMTDALTSLGNRRYLDEVVKAPLEKYGVHMGSVTVLMLDIDFFKKYNDRYGHQQGDQCLKSVAAVMADFAKISDFRPIRYGGEEFILVMTGLAPETVMEKAEQLRQSIAAVKIPSPDGSENSVTVSVGVSYHQSRQSGLLETAISEADHAMYQAKQSGRNMSVLYSK